VCDHVEEGPDGQPEQPGDAGDRDGEELVLGQRRWLQLKTET
jgi:hypothetical protein